MEPSSTNIVLNEIRVAGCELRQLTKVMAKGGSAAKACER